MRRIAATAAFFAVMSLISSKAVIAETPGVIPAQEAASQAKTVKYSINWVNSLPKAQEQARREHKPIFWLHILGNIDGFA